MPDTQNKNHTGIFIGVDLGTSGVRAIAIDADRQLIAQASQPLPAPAGEDIEPIPELWWITVKEVLNELTSQIDPTQVKAMAVDGTSATILLAGSDGTPLGPVLMYHDTRSREQSERIAAHAPQDSAVHGPASGLAKLLYLLDATDIRGNIHVVSQADWIRGRLGGRYDISDKNNCLKLGYDPANHRWPDWLGDLGVTPDVLPAVVSPGTPIGSIAPQVAQALGLPTGVTLVAGTTDSTAAFIATGAKNIGDAVTSLGSTLVIKVICEQPVFAPEYGVYSQPLADRWLVGGASNSGGAVLRQYFSDEQMIAMTPQLQPEQPTNLDYYPLPAVGERFPINDPAMQPRITPRPDDDAQFFQALLEGIAHIEQRGYALLAELGAPYPTSVRTVGGGASNPAWTHIREQLLQVPMIQSEHEQAAYGAALLALQGFSYK